MFCPSPGRPKEQTENRSDEEKKKKKKPTIAETEGESTKRGLWMRETESRGPGRGGRSVRGRTLTPSSKGELWVGFSGNEREREEMQTGKVDGARQNFGPRQRFLEV